MLLFFATFKVCPITSMMRARSPAGMVSSEMTGQVSEPRMGFWKRIWPFCNSVTSRMIMPVSPRKDSLERPDLVRSGFLKKRIHRNTMAPEVMAHKANWAASESGIRKTSTPTSNAPSPNQMIKNEGMASSSRISSKPPAIQCHHAISIAPSGRMSTTH